jgi:DNA recombination protein RmuC
MANLIFQILVVAALVSGFAVVFYLLKRRSQEENPALKILTDWMTEMKQSTEATRESMQKNLQETNRAISERLDRAAQVIGALSKELGSMTQIGPDIRRLSDVLASPKTRGNFGEEILENMLSQVLPKEAYAMQYRFKNGEVVDAIVRVGERILPVDSKFSMENFRLYKEAKTDESQENLRRAFLRDVRKRMDEIHKKYILPQEGTFDFAFMYIPSEGVFGEVLDDSSTLAYARDKKVYFVSPNTLYHHLQIVLLSLRGQKINEAAQTLLAMISGIKQESDKFGRNLDVLSTHIKNAHNSMGTVANDFGKLKASITNAATLQLEEAEALKEQTAETEKLIE